MKRRTRTVIRDHDVVRRALVVASCVLVIAAVLLLTDDIVVWWPAHPGLHACYACPVPGAFPWWQAAADVLAVALVALFWAWNFAAGDRDQPDDNVRQAIRDRRRSNSG